MLIHILLQYTHFYLYPVSLPKTPPSLFVPPPSSVLALSLFLPFVYFSWYNSGHSTHWLLQLVPPPHPGPPHPWRGGGLFPTRRRGAAWCDIIHCRRPSPNRRTRIDILIRFPPITAPRAFGAGLGSPPPSDIRHRAGVSRHHAWSFSHSPAAVSRGTDARAPGPGGVYLSTHWLRLRPIASAAILFLTPYRLHHSMASCTSACRASPLPTMTKVTSYPCITLCLPSADTPPSHPSSFLTHFSTILQAGPSRPSLAWTPG